MKERNGPECGISQKAEGRVKKGNITSALNASGAEGEEKQN
jgi:hypothetical protein